MTDTRVKADSPEFLAATGGSQSPAELADLVAAWKKDRELMLYWALELRDRFGVVFVSEAEIEEAHARTLAAACAYIHSAEVPE